MDDSTTPKLFYVYVLSRPDGRQFYVGKGQGQRVDEHEREARRGCKCHKCCIIRKIWRTGGNISKAVVFRTDDEFAAYQREAELIAAFGVRNLANVRPGAIPFLVPHANRPARNYFHWKSQMVRHGMKAEAITAAIRKEFEADCIRELEDLRRQWKGANVRGDLRLRRRIEAQIWAVRVDLGRRRQRTIFEEPEDE